MAPPVASAPDSRAGRSHANEPHANCGGDSLRARGPGTPPRGRSRNVGALTSLRPGAGDGGLGPSGTPDAVVRRPHTRPRRSPLSLSAAQLGDPGISKGPVWSGVCTTPRVHARSVHPGGQNPSAAAPRSPAHPWPPAAFGKDPCAPITLPSPLSLQRPTPSPKPQLQESKDLAPGRFCSASPLQHRRPSHLPHSLSPTLQTTAASSHQCHRVVTPRSHLSPPQRTHCPHLPSWSPTVWPVGPLTPWPPSGLSPMPPSLRCPVSPSWSGSSKGPSQIPPTPP